MPYSAIITTVASVVCHLTDSLVDLELAPPPAKRQQINNGGRAIADKGRAARRGSQVVGSWPPPTVGDQPPPSKTTQTDFPDPSTLAESLPMLIELKDDKELDTDERRHFQKVARFAANLTSSYLLTYLPTYEVVLVTSRASDF